MRAAELGRSATPAVLPAAAEDEWAAVSAAHEAALASSAAAAAAATVGIRDQAAAASSSAVSRFSPITCRDAARLLCADGELLRRYAAAVCLWDQSRLPAWRRIKYRLTGSKELRTKELTRQREGQLSSGLSGAAPHSSRPARSHRLLCCWPAALSLACEQRYSASLPCPSTGRTVGRRPA